MHTVFFHNIPEDHYVISSMLVTFKKPDKPDKNKYNLATAQYH
jgi:hypothetical protein